MTEGVPSIGSDLTPLESAVLAAVCAMHSADRAALEVQLSTATLISRENTGAGFFTHFAVDRSRSVAVGGQRLRNGPEAKIAGLTHGMGFILWLKEGYADCLEGYCYAGSTTGIALETIKFEIRANESM